MKLVHNRCAALDVHKKSITACVREVKGKEVQVERGTFGTFTDDLTGLAQWLKKRRVTEVAMESTGVYWIPVWNVLEQERYGLNLTLVNPAVVKAMPGSKTDAKDAARIAELHQYGLLRGSFIPPEGIRQMRDLTRRRTTLQREAARVLNRMEALLERANVKLSAVVSDLSGVSSQRMLYAISEGRTDPEGLAGLALGSLAEKEAELVKALKGNYNEHFRKLLAALLEDLRQARKKTADLDQEIRKGIEPYADLAKRLCTIPGVDEVASWILISEIGADLKEFPTAGHLANWAGLCPGNDESAGKRRSGRARKGNRHLRRLLTQCGWAATNKKNCFLGSLFHRVAYRRGMKRGVVAVAHRILVIAYDVIKRGSTYRELGGDYHARKNVGRTARKLTERLESLGFRVRLEPVKAMAEEAAAAEPVEPVAQVSSSGPPVDRVEGNDASEPVPPDEPK